MIFPDMKYLAVKIAEKLSLILKDREGRSAPFRPITTQRSTRCDILVFALCGHWKSVRVDLSQTRHFFSISAKGERLQSSNTEPERIGLHHLLGRLPRDVSRKLLLGERPLKLPEGETLFERGDIGDGCYWLRRGVLAVYVASATGEQRILAILGPNAIVGELAMIDGLPRSASVRALRDCELTFVSRAAFTDMLRRHPELYNDIVTTLAARLRQTDEDMAASSFQTVRSRVARALLQFAHHLGEEARPGRVVIRHRITQSDLAAMAGVARESVSRTLSGWQRQKILEGSARTGLVVHKARLEDAAAE
jgi:CRP/FNR family transcriptional regulator, cyclic AMP receptor protein